MSTIKKQYKFKIRQEKKQDTIEKRDCLYGNYLYIPVILSGHHTIPVPLLKVRFNYKGDGLYGSYKYIQLILMGHHTIPVPLLKVQYKGE